MFYQAESFKQQLCGDSWIDSRATNKFMFASSEGSLADKPCSFVADNRRPVSQDMRELIKREEPTNQMDCPKCGRFGKSSRVSCCAPGGTWFKKCGSVINENVQYTWSQGTAACKKTLALTTTAASSGCLVCGSVKKSRKKSCCGRGGSWFGTCGGAGNKKATHTWFEGIKVCEKRRAEYKAALGAFESSAADDEPLSFFFKQLNVSTAASADSTSTEVLTTAPAPTRALATQPVKETPISTTAESVSHDEFFEGIPSESISFTTSYIMHALFLICAILFP